MVSASPLISIVVPCYQAEKFLPETLESVAKQTYENWELIIVEDGSKDSTESIVQKFRLKKEAHEIQYRRLEKTRGPSAARNEGIRNSKGLWVAFLDSDDLWSPQHLECLLENAKSTSSGVSYCSAEFFDSESGKVQGLWGPTQSDLEHFPETLFSRNYILPSGVLIKRAPLEKILFEEAPEVQSCEDHDFWMSLLKEGVSFSWTSAVKVRYRKNHPGAATANRERMFRADLEVMSRHLTNPLFSQKTKRRGLAQNYTLLAEALLEKRNWKALFFYLRSWGYSPFQTSQLKRLIRAIWILGFRSAD